MAAPQRVLFSWVLSDGTTTGQVMLDASLNEQHGASAEITKQQVEKGSDITDHVRPLPGSLVIEGVVSNTPLDATTLQGVTGSVQDIAVTVNGKQVKYRAFKFDSQFDRVRDVFGDIVDAVQDGALFSVTTTLKRYENYATHDFAVQRNAEKGNKLHFTISFSEIKIVETQEVAALPAKVQPKKLGAKSGKQVDQATDKRVSTMRATAKKIGDGIGSTLKAFGF